MDIKELRYKRDQLKLSIATMDALNDLDGAYMAAPKHWHKELEELDITIVKKELGE